MVHYYIEIKMQCHRLVKLVEFKQVHTIIECGHSALWNTRIELETVYNE